MEVLGFLGSGCGPCTQQRPIWESLPVEVRIVDVDLEPDLRARYAVEALPTTLVLADGEVTQVLRGLSTTRQILEALGAAVA